MKEALFYALCCIISLWVVLGYHLTGDNAPVGLFCFPLHHTLPLVYVHVLMLMHMYASIIASYSLRFLIQQDSYTHHRKDFHLKAFFLAGLPTA